MSISIDKYLSPTLNTKSRISLDKYNIQGQVKSPPITTPSVSVSKPVVKSNIKNNPFDKPIGSSLKILPGEKTTPDIIPNIPTSVSNSTKSVVKPNEISPSNTKTEELISIPKSAISDFSTKFKESISQHNAQNVAIDLAKKNKTDLPAGTFSKTFGKDIETAASGVGVLFTPISMFTKVLEDTGGITGAATKLVNKAFELGGKITGNLLVKGLDVMPISQTSKDNLHQATKDVGNLIGQVLVAHGVTKLGGKIMPKEAATELHSDVIKNIEESVAKHKGEITPEIAKKIATDALTKTVDVMDQQIKLLPERTPKPNVTVGEGFTMKDVADKVDVQISKAQQKFEKSLTDYNKNPTEVNLSNVLKNKERVTELSKPVEVNPTKPTIEGQATQINNVASELKPKNVEAVTEVTGEKLTPKVATDIEKTLKDSNLLPENFKDLPETEKITFEDQFRKTDELIKADRVRAEKILTGDEPMPSNLRSGFFLQRMRELAKNEKSPELAYKLANSPLLSETSMHAQEVGSYKALQPDSMVSHFSEIRKARDANVKKTTGKDPIKAKSELVKKGKETINKQSAPKIKDWASFLDNIKCK